MKVSRSELHQHLQRESATVRIDLSRLVCVNSPLDFRSNVWYVTLLEGGESFGATEEEEQAKLY